MAGLFVEFLAWSYSEGWRAFLEAVHGGEEVRAAFETHVGRTLGVAWGEFVESVRSRGDGGGG